MSSRCGTADPVGTAVSGGTAVAADPRSDVVFALTGRHGIIVSNFSAKCVIAKALVELCIREGDDTSR